MRKFKFLFVSVVTVLVMVAVFVLWIQPKPQPVQKNFPPKVADISPTLPAPRGLVLGGLINGGVKQDIEIVFVPRVVDGDTIVVEAVDPISGAIGKRETVRYIGMDTPETVSPKKPVECYGHEASARNKELVEGKYVAIVKDVSDRDKYGRLLRFVYLLNAATSSEAGEMLQAMPITFVDLELVKEGYARVLTIPPDTEHTEEFNAAASTAQTERLGFWGACASYPFL